MRKVKFSGLAASLGVCVLGLVVAAPLYTAHKRQLGETSVFAPSATHDMAQHLAVMQEFDVALRSGDLYPRWMADFNKGYGSPWTSFYPPGFYYVSSAVNLPVGNWYVTLFLISGLGLGLSAITFYFAATDLYGKLPSMIGAVLYMILPYHLVELYWRGAMPEFVAFVLLPPVFYFGTRLALRARPSYLAGFAISYGILLIVHLPVSFLLAYALVFYAALRAILYKDARILLRIAAGMALAFGLSAFYLVPAVLEQKYIYQPWTSLFRYSASYLHIVRSADSFGRLLNLCFISCSLVLGIGLLAAVALPGDRAAGHEEQPQSIKPKLELFTIVTMGVGALLMCTTASRSVTRLLPKIDVASFAWRWLAIASFFACLAMVAGLDRLVRDFRSRSAVGVSLAAAIVIVFGVNLWVAGHSTIWAALLHPPLDTAPGYIDPGFTPKNSTRPEDLPGDVPKAELVPVNGFLSVDRWDPADRRLTVSAVMPCELRIRTYDFPGWTAAVNGAPMKIIDDEVGAQTLKLTPGNYTIDLRFGTTPARSAGLTISCAALAILALLGVLTWFRVTAGARKKSAATIPAPESSEVS
ncbi:MAG TPA: 6-pyruvoyl-tetrahydropterin synthase-related protein [Blastocatellia bacterium]